MYNLWNLFLYKYTCFFFVFILKVIPEEPIIIELVELNISRGVSMATFSESIDAFSFLGSSPYVLYIKNKSFMSRIESRVTL